MLNLIYEDTMERMDKAVSVTMEEFSKLRTGKATPAIVEHVKIDAYGTMVPMNQVANIGTPDATLLIVIAADLGLNPSNDGQIIRIPIPSLSEERRKELVKVSHRYAEEGRVAIRNIRRDANDQIKKAEKDESGISEDEMHRAFDRIQELTDKEVARIDDLLKKKEEQILEV